MRWLCFLTALVLVFIGECFAAFGEWLVSWGQKIDKGFM
jgi:hypothetical protein